MQGCRVQRLQNVVFTSHVDRGAVFRAIYKLKEFRPSFLFYGRMPRPIAPKCCLYLPRGLLNFSFINKSFLTPSIIHLHQVQGSHNGHLVKVIFCVPMLSIIPSHQVEQCHNGFLLKFVRVLMGAWELFLRHLYYFYTKHKDTKSDFSSESSLCPSWTKELLLLHL